MLRLQLESTDVEFCLESVVDYSNIKTREIENKLNVRTKVMRMKLIYVMKMGKREHTENMTLQSEVNFYLCEYFYE